MSYPQPLAPSTLGFIRSDIEALASHMQHCATAHGRWAVARAGLQHLRSMAAGRIVTLACIAVLLGTGFAIAA